MDAAAVEYRSDVADAPEEGRRAEGRGNGDVHAAPDAPAPQTGEGARIRLHAEELHVHKRFVETGEVRVRKEVVTEHRTIDVPVRREEIVIERHAPTDEDGAVFDLKPGEEIRIPVRREQVTVEKRPVVTEEVTVGKRLIEATEHVGGEVRKEEVRVERVERAEQGNGHAAPGRTPAGEQGAVTAQGDEEALIRRRAYFKWLGEGCPSGQDRRHYLEAAREVHG
jgi:uncharacterized protein (TIGR02271 family)